MIILILLLVLLVSGCTTVKEVYSAKDKRCLRNMEFAMRHAVPYLVGGGVSLEVMEEWVKVKYECWKEGPVE